MEEGNTLTDRPLPPCSVRGCSEPATQLAGHVPSCLRDAYKLSDGPHALCAEHGSFVCSGPRHAEQPDGCAPIGEYRYKLNAALAAKRGWD